jgi:hypothetical protein
MQIWKCKFMLSLSSTSAASLANSKWCSCRDSTTRWIKASRRRASASGHRSPTGVSSGHRASAFGEVILYPLKTVLHFGLEVALNFAWDFVFYFDWTVHFHVPRNPVIQIWHGVCFSNPKEPPLSLWIGPKSPARCKTKSRADTGAIPWQSSWVWMVGMTSPHSRCARGDRCTFAHFESELRPRRDW